MRAVLQGSKTGTTEAAQNRRKEEFRSPRLYLPLPSLRQPRWHLQAAARQVTGTSAGSSIAPCSCATIPIYPFNQAASLHAAITDSIKLSDLRSAWSGLWNSRPISAHHSSTHTAQRTQFSSALARQGRNGRSLGSEPWRIHLLCV